MTGIGSEGAGLAELVTLSLTGTRIPAPIDSASRAEDADSIARMLRDAGWSSTRLAELRDARHAAGQGWPMLVPAADRGDVGAAQLFSATQTVLELLGAGPQARLRDHHQPLGMRDKALQAERPPHHGAVG